MPEGLTFVVGILLGMLIGLVASAAFQFSERQRAKPMPTNARKETGATATAVLNAVPQPHIIVQPDDTVERASSLAYAYGLIRDHALRPDVLDVVRETRKDGSIVDLELAIPRATLDDAVDRRVWLRAAPLTGNRVLVLFEDNTEKRRLEETRRDFVANVSHELKTPVGAISLLAETLVEVAEEPDHVRSFGAKLAVESKRLGNLVQEIIQLSQLQEGDSLADSQLVDVDTVVAEAVDRIRVEAEARNVTVKSGGEKGLKVYGDPGLLTTAVRNLLDNAVRYSAPHQRVSVGVSSYDGEVSIAVVDQGEGISREMRDRIFERFYRGDKARSRETGGSGLGLSIVKHVLVDHGGRIKVWSEPGKGSTFTMILPQAFTPEIKELVTTTPVDLRRT
ncbi:MAG: two-component sensor histidine kinase [Actinomycetaceae bacterium]|nr:two-component sensor histidine kinase [Actinomycetaceae bacterium]